MKIAAITAISAGLLTSACMGSSHTFASDADVVIEDAVARVIVIVEDRQDIGVEVAQGSSGLPALMVKRENGRVRIDGQLGRPMGRSKINDCRTADVITDQPGQGASVEVRDLGRVDLANAPLITLRVPRSVSVGVDGAVFGAIGGGATKVDLGNRGCGDWFLADANGPVDLGLSGSGDAVVGSSRALDVSISGSGDVKAGATSTLDLAISGSGAFDIASVNGNVDTAISGTGDVLVRGGNAPRLDVSIAGSGDVDFQGVVGDADVSIAGAGDVRIAQVTGTIDRAVAGAGNIMVGSQ